LIKPGDHKKVVRSDFTSLPIALPSRRFIERSQRPYGQRRDQRWRVKQVTSVYDFRCLK